MKKVVCLIIIMAFLILGCSNKRLDGENNYNVVKTLKVKDSDGNILQTYHGDEVDSISDDMKEDTWEILLHDIPKLKEKYLFSFNEKVDEKRYKKDVTVDYIFDEDMVYVKVVTYEGMPDDTYYKIPEETQSNLKKIMED